MKGIVLAGGAGTRLYPATLAISKQLLPVYDKPMIYYPISTLMLAGIRDILLISTPDALPLYQHLLGDGAAFGLNLSYAPQPKPDGLAQAFIIGRDFVGQDSVSLVLGDNVFFGAGLRELLECVRERKTGATIFGYHVEDPERYGVVAFDETGRATDIVEKPAHPPSSWAATGLYFYDNRVLDVAASIKPSPRGELEITDVNRVYLEWGELFVEKLGRGYAWLDTGTHDSLLEASEFVRTIQHRTGQQIACLEEIAFVNGFIGLTDLQRRIRMLGKTAYAKYLSHMVTEATAQTRAAS
jgi:glucose-1-phosphate thymidylyltransferase